MIFIPEDFKSIRIKKTNIVAKRLLEGTIREIKKCPKEARENTRKCQLDSRYSKDT